MDSSAAQNGPGSWRWLATRTLSMTDMSPNSRMFWNVRAMPAWATCAGRRVVISRPASRMLPVVGRTIPESRLNRVVLPAPLGPMTPWMRPSGRSSE